MLGIFVEQENVAWNHSKIQANISISILAVQKFLSYCRLPFADAKIHVLNGTLVYALTIFQIVQNVHHFVINFIDFARDIAAHAWFVDQKWNVVSCANYERHFGGCSCLAPVFCQSIGWIA